MKKRVKKIISLLLIAVLLMSENISVLAASGTSNAPYNLSQGKTCKKSIEKNTTKWFKLKDRGAINITIDTDEKASITIYEKKTIGKNKLATFKCNGKITKKYNAYKNKTYLISVETTKKKTTKITYKLNVDSYKSKKGGYWESKNSPQPLPGIVYVAKYYIPAGAVPAAYNSMGNDEYLAALSKARNMTTNAALIYLGNVIKLPAKCTKVMKKAGQLKILYDILEPFPSFSLGELYQKDIKEKAGYNVSTGKVENGICIDFYYTQGVKMYHVSAWKTNKMTGPEGYTGEFHEFD